MDDDNDLKVDQPAAKTARAGEDLSAAIAAAVERGPREEVTCRRVSRNHYRCNWWAPQNISDYDNPSMHGMLVTTSRICKSRFLRVTKTAQGLQFTDVKT